MKTDRLTFYEIFAGGGMVRAGLGSGWDCLFANDIDIKKAASYQANWGAPGVLRVGDIAATDVDSLPGLADLAWASFPCQDLSLAGSRAGLAGDRSGTFYAFWDVIRQLVKSGRRPSIVALENVVGTITSRNGADFRTVCSAFVEHGYRFGAMVVNADLFVPQSRPRVFFVGVSKDVPLPSQLLASGPVDPFHTKAVESAFSRLDEVNKSSWLWWNVPTPPRRNTVFSDMIDDIPDGVDWHSEKETARLLELMSETNRAKLDAAKRARRKIVGGVYKRTRVDAAGRKRQRAEVRFDDVSGCLRTPSGGSSRQTLLVVEGEAVRSRLISARETARLMGLPEHYVLPKRYNQAYHLTGDGVVVPVVSHLARFIFEPVLLADSIDVNASSTARRALPA